MTNVVFYYGYGPIVGTEGNDTLEGQSTGGYGGGYRPASDWISGLGGDDLLYGRGGNDSLEGGTGNDTLDGGGGYYHSPGMDFAIYDNSAYGIVANLEFGEAHNDPAASWADENDILINIEGLSGSAHNDHFQGNEGYNVLRGNGGNDVLFGWGGGDDLEGGAGADSLLGGDGNDTVFGGDGHDFLQGNNGFDLADYTDAGHAMFVDLSTNDAHGGDLIPPVIVARSTAVGAFGGWGTWGTWEDSDSLYGIEGVRGTSFNDTILGDAAANLLQGSDGNDRLSGGEGNDTLEGGNGDDHLNPGTGQDSVNGGAGIDMLDYTASASAVTAYLGSTAGDGANVAYLSGIENFAGSQFGDWVEGTGGDNLILGHAGNDSLYGEGGGGGPVILLAGEDTPVGNDTLEGGAGDDLIDGRGGNDLLIGGAGGDEHFGGEGWDIASYASSAAAVKIDRGFGLASGGDADGDTLNLDVEGVIGSSFADTLNGGGAGDEFHAGGGNDRMAGRGGYDSLCGDAGRDTISGGTGRDLIVGGEGRDVMSGGLDRDTFRFDFLTDSAVGLQRDVVRDFAKGLDKIDVSGIDAHQYLIGDQAFTYIGQDPFTKPDPNAFSFGSAGQLRSFFNGTNTIIEGDVTGDAKADFQIALAGNINLSALDFVL